MSTKKSDHEKHYKAAELQWLGDCDRYSAAGAPRHLNRADVIELQKIVAAWGEHTASRLHACFELWGKILRRRIADATGRDYTQVPNEPRLTVIADALDVCDRAIDESAHMLTRPAAIADEPPSADAEKVATAWQAWLRQYVIKTPMSGSTVEKMIAVAKDTKTFAAVIRKVGLENALHIVGDLWQSAGTALRWHYEQQGKQWDFPSTTRPVDLLQWCEVLLAWERSQAESAQAANMLQDVQARTEARSGRPSTTAIPV